MQVECQLKPKHKIIHKAFHNKYLCLFQWTDNAIMTVAILATGAWRGYRGRQNGSSPRFEATEVWKANWSNVEPSPLEDLHRTARACFGAARGAAFSRRRRQRKTLQKQLLGERCRGLRPSDPALPGLFRQASPGKTPWLLRRSVRSGQEPLLY